MRLISNINDPEAKPCVINSQLFSGPTESLELDGFFLLTEGSVIICFIISLYAYCE